MRTPRLGQKGFSAVSVGLFLLVLFVIGAIGFAVYSHRDTTSTPKVAPRIAKPAPATDENSTALASHRLFVDEWDVAIQYVGDPVLHYNYIDQSRFPDYPFDFITFYLPARSDGSSACDSNGGTYIRFDATKPYYDVNNVKDTADATVAEYAAKLPTTEYVHAGGYYYFYRSPKQICTDAASLQAQNQISAKAKAALSSLTAD